MLTPTPLGSTLSGISAAKVSSEKNAITASILVPWSFKEFFDYDHSSVGKRNGHCRNNGNRLSIEQCGFIFPLFDSILSGLD